MQWLFEPTGWIALLILSVMLIALGVEHIIRVGDVSADLSAKDQQRALAFSLGLACALILVLLLATEWFKSWGLVFGVIAGHSMTSSKVLLLLAGLFLLSKATLDLSERSLVERHEDADGNAARLSMVRTPIGQLTLMVAITALALAHALAPATGLILTAFVVAALVLLLRRRALLEFVRLYPSVMVLSRSYLLLIGALALLQGLGSGVPAVYLLGVLVLTLLLGLGCGFLLGKRLQPDTATGLRERTLEAVLRVLDERSRPEASGASADQGQPEQSGVGLEQLHMMSGVLTLADRSVHSIMTPRTEVTWLDIDDKAEHIRAQIEQAPHSFFPVCRGELDEIIGIGRAKRLIADLLTHGRIQESRLREPLIVHDTISIIRLIDTLKQSRGQLVLIADEFGAIEGLVTPIDVFEAIAGEFPDEDETPDIVPDGPNRWRVDGAADLHLLEQVLGVEGLVHEQEDYSTLAGYLLTRFGRLPHVGEQCEFEADTTTVRFKVVRLERRRIAMVHVEITSLDTSQTTEQKD